MNLSECGEYFSISVKELDKLDMLKPIDFITIIPMLGWSLDEPDMDNNIPVSLMYYIDDHGDFTEKNDVHSKIANAMFNSLRPHGKISVMKYLLWYNEDE